MASDEDTKALSELQKIFCEDKYLEHSVESISWQDYEVVFPLHSNNLSPLRSKHMLR